VWSRARGFGGSSIFSTIVAKTAIEVTTCSPNAGIVRRQSCQRGVSGGEKGDACGDGVRAGADFELLSPVYETKNGTSVYLGDKPGSARR